MSADTIIAIAGSLLCAIVSVVTSYKLTKIGKREDDRIMGNRLLFWGVRASGGLAKQSALAWQRGTANGELTKALEAYENFENEMDKYVEKQAAMRNNG